MGVAKPAEAAIMTVITKGRKSTSKSREVASARCQGTNKCKGLNACKTDKNDCAGKSTCKGTGKCGISDKNLAVKLAAKKMSEKRVQTLKQP